MEKETENPHLSNADGRCRECRAAAYELASLALLAAWAVWMLVRILALAADPNSFASYLPAFPLLLLSISAELMADSEADGLGNDSMQTYRDREQKNTRNS